MKGDCCFEFVGEQFYYCCVYGEEEIVCEQQWVVGIVQEGECCI